MKGTIVIRKLSDGSKRYHAVFRFNSKQRWKAFNKPSTTRRRRPLPISPKQSRSSTPRCPRSPLSSQLEQQRWQAPEATPAEGFEAPAEAQDIQYYLQRLFAELDKAGFLQPTEKAPAMMRSIRALHMRMDPTDQDLRTLHGIISALIRRQGT